MKKSLIAFVLLASVALVGCGQKPMTDADMASQYGLSLEEYQEQKEAAARMNMSIEDHLNMGGGQDGGSHMMPDGTMMKNSEMNHDMDSTPESEMDSHEQAAADMGMTLEEHEAAGHIGH